MHVTIPPDIQRSIDERIRSGKYRTAEDVIAAAVSALDQQESLGDFQAGELDQLLAAGEESGSPLDGEPVLSELRDLRTRCSYRTSS